MTLDNVVYHTETDFPEGLGTHHAATHMGFYWAWAVRRSLHSPQWDEAAGADMAALQSGRISGAEFVMRHMGGGLEEGDFSGEGLRFTRFYYADDDEGYGRFMEDYVHTLNTPVLPSFYHVAASVGNQALLDLIFDAALAQWRDSLKTGAERTANERANTQ